MGAFIFLCDATTERECLDRQLFGTNFGESHRIHFSGVAIGDTLFLYNLDTGTLRGPYIAKTVCTMNLEKDAWKATKRKFPWQVRVDPAGCHKNPLSAGELRAIVPMTSSPAGLMPQPSLDEEELAAVINAFRKINPV